MTLAFRGLMANIESYATINYSVDGISVNEAGDVALNDLSRSNIANEANLLASISNEKFLESTCNGLNNDISSRDVTTITPNVEGVLSNVGTTHYVNQELPQTGSNALGAFSGTEFDFQSVNNANENQSSYAGSANLFNVPNQTNAIENNQIYFYEDVKVEGNVNQVPQAEVHAVPVNSIFGLSQNSIKVVQQGNQLGTLQNLTQEQLGQLIRLVQQQRNNTSVNQETMFYDPNTQQRTVYKISYADQPVGNALASTHSGTNATTANNSLQPKRQHIEAADVLLKMDKEHKKKHRPRTRSGRVSKPPQYMVKDYKHIHPVDYDEDYDDSDGGYSDFKLSSGEEDNKNNADNPLSYASLKSKRFKCDYCEKSYIGKGGLNRHYKLNPAHGKPDDEAGNEDSFYSSDSFQSGVLASSFNNAENNVGLSKKPRIDDEVTLALEVFPNGEPKQRDTEGTYRGGRRGRRGRPPTSNADDKRRQKLYEASRNCSDEDILDLFIRRCPFTVSLWDILSLKNSKVYDSSVDSLLGEVTNLHDQISSYLADRLVPFSEEDCQSCEDGCDLSDKNIFEMVDDKLAACLNLRVGKYMVKSEPASTSPNQKSQLIRSAGSSKAMQFDARRSVSIKQQDSEQSILLPPRKRLKLSGMSVKEKQDACPSVSNYDKLIPSEIFQSKASIFCAGESSALDGLSSRTVAAAFQDKAKVLDGPDDSLVSSTSQVNFFPVGDSGTNLTDSSGFNSSLPDSSLHSALAQSASNSNFHEIWSDIAKTSGDCQIATNSNLASLNLSSSFVGASDMESIKIEPEDQSRASLESMERSDQVASQLPADSYSNVADASSAEQGICVTCYPMQEYIQVQENARYIQTEDGLVIVKNPDGSYHIYGDLTQNITLEMLEAHFAN